MCTVYVAGTQREEKIPSDVVEEELLRVVSYQNGFWQHDIGLVSS